MNLVTSAVLPGLLDECPRICIAGKVVFLKREVSPMAFRMVKAAIPRAEDQRTFAHPDRDPPTASVVLRGLLISVLDFARLSWYTAV